MFSVDESNEPLWCELHLNSDKNEPCATICFPKLKEAVLYRVSEIMINSFLNCTLKI